MAAPHVEFVTKNVNTAGTRAVITDTTRKVLKIWFKPHEGNTGDVYLGDSAVTATTNAWSISNTDDPESFDFRPSPPTQDFFYLDAANTNDKLDLAFLLE